MERVEKIRECHRCTEKCPQAKLARDIAEGRMYATNEMIRLQKELQEYKDLEEQGLLLRLPCKVGDLVYTTNELNNKIQEWEIVSVEIYRSGVYYKVKSTDKTSLHIEFRGLYCKRGYW